jgi:uncharacterized protein (DUF1697 family)
MGITNTNRYVVLLRGINVGGNNVIKMTDLKKCFTEMGFADVCTYIQSGNVMISSEEKNILELAERIERELSNSFKYNSKVVVISAEDLKRIITGAPNGFGNAPDKCRYDVIFLRWPLSATQAIKIISTKEGVDSVEIGPGVLYFSRLISKATQSYLPKIIKLPIYKEITIRNWNTTTKMLSITQEIINK